MTGSGFSIRLADAPLVSRGHMRLVFEHNDFPGALIKVVNPDILDAQGYLTGGYQRKRRWLRRRVGGFLALRRELAEFLVVSRQVRHGDWPIARIFGFVETELGLGLVVERIAAPDGGLAPTLHDMLDAGQFQPSHYPPLLRFFDELAQLHVCIGNLHMKNIVFTGRLGEDGRFVGIDGLGDKAFVPLAEWSKRFNAWQLLRRRDKLLARIETRAKRPT